MFYLAYVHGVLTISMLRSKKNNERQIFECHRNGCHGVRIKHNQINPMPMDSIVLTNAHYIFAFRREVVVSMIKLTLKELEKLLYCIEYLRQNYEHKDELTHLSDKLAHMIADYSGCAVEGCDKPYHRRGHCAMHDTRIRRHGDPDINLKRKWLEQECIFEGCNLEGRKKGLCQKHYEYMRRRRVKDRLSASNNS